MPGPVIKGSNVQVVDRRHAENLGFYYLLLYHDGLLPLGTWVQPQYFLVNHKPGYLASKAFPPVKGRTISVGLRYAHAYNAVIPFLHREAQAWAKECLEIQEGRLWRLNTQIMAPGIANRLHLVAKRVGNRMGGFQPSREDVARAFALQGNMWGYGPLGDDDNVRKYFKKMSEARRAQVAEALRYEMLDASNKVDSDPRERIAIDFEKEDIRLLGILFAHPRGVEIIQQYWVSPSNGTELASELVKAAALATRDFRETLAENPEMVWRYPILVTGAVYRLGLHDVAWFPEFAVALGQVLGRSTTETVLNEAGKVLFLATLVLPSVPGLVLAFSLLDLALMGGEVALTYIRDREREVAAEASGFSSEDARLAESTGFHDTALAGAAALAAALFIFLDGAQLILRRRARELPDVIPPRETPAGTLDQYRPPAIVGGENKQGLDAINSGRPTPQERGIDELLPTAANELSAVQNLAETGEKSAPSPRGAAQAIATPQVAAPRTSSPIATTPPISAPAQPSPAALAAQTQRGTKQRGTKQRSTKQRSTKQRGTVHSNKPSLPGQNRRRLRTKSNVNTINRTAGTGGIKDIWAYRHPDGSYEYQITGDLLPPLVREAPSTPKFNELQPKGSEIGLPDYEVSHLWAIGFGDEAWDGMMLAPQIVNQKIQGRVERRLRELREQAQGYDATIELVATARSHPIFSTPPKGHQLLAEVRYEAWVHLPNGDTLYLGRAEIVVPPPNSSRLPDVDVIGGFRNL
jgi:hypothetical protein